MSRDTQEIDRLTAELAEVKAFAELCLDEKNTQLKLKGISYDQLTAKTLECEALREALVEVRTESKKRPRTTDTDYYCLVNILLIVDQALTASVAGGTKSKQKGQR